MALTVPFATHGINKSIGTGTVQYINIYTASQSYCKRRSKRNEAEKELYFKKFHLEYIFKSFGSFCTDNVVHLEIPEHRTKKLLQYVTSHKT
jgi:hypothetical protein